MQPEGQVNKLFCAFPGTLQGQHKHLWFAFGTGMMVQGFLSRRINCLTQEGTVGFSLRLWMSELTAEVRTQEDEN